MTIDYRVFCFWRVADGNDGSDGGAFHLVFASCARCRLPTTFDAPLSPTEHLICVQIHTNTQTTINATAKNKCHYPRSVFMYFPDDQSPSRSSDICQFTILIIYHFRHPSFHRSSNYSYCRVIRLSDCFSDLLNFIGFLY